MKINWALFILVFCVCLHNAFGLLDKLGKLMKNKNKPGLFAKKPGKGGGGSNCDCPCREYWTTRCAVEYKTECKQLYTHRDCKKVPVKKPMRVRETECQKCVKFFETVMETKSVRQCQDVYDEQCETTYPAKCVQDKSCTMIYRTQCEMAGYSQKCQQVPTQKCDPITKCHRIPKTTCRPIMQEKCGNKDVQVPMKKLRNRCMPYEERQPADMSECTNDSSPSSSYGTPQSNPISNGYGSPQGLPETITVTVADMNAQAVPPPPAPPLPPVPPPGGNQDTYGSPAASVIQSYDPFTNTPVTSPNNVPLQTEYSIINNNNPTGPTNQGSTFSNLIQDSVSAPSIYASPSYNNQANNLNLNPRINPVAGLPSQRSEEEQRSTLATIRVVNPPALASTFQPVNSVNVANSITVSNPATNTIPVANPLNPIQLQTTAHPNQLLRDFKPSVRLPDNFVHQIGNAFLNNDFQIVNTQQQKQPEIFRTAGSSSTKKMVFPQSSEELDVITEPNNVLTTTNNIQQSHKDMIQDEMYYDDISSGGLEDISDFDEDYYANSDYAEEDSIQALLFQTNQGLGIPGFDKSKESPIESSLEVLKENATKEQSAEKPDLKLRRRRRRRKKKPHRPVQGSFGDKIFG